MGSTIDGLKVGVLARAMNLSVMGYGSATALGLDAGAMAEIGRRAAVAVSGKNINLPCIGPHTEELPVSLRCGVVVQPSPGALLFLCLAAEGNLSQSIRSGLEVGLNHDLVFRVGLEPLERKFAAGAGFRASSILLDYGVSAQDPLGLTHGISLCYTVFGR